MDYKVLKTREEDIHDIAIMIWEDMNEQDIPTDAKADMLKQVIDSLPNEDENDDN